MFRKLKIKTLGLVFIGLLVITVIVKMSDSRRGINTLKAELFKLDEEAISSLIIKPRVLNGESIELKKDNGEWRVMYKGKSYNGDAATIDRLIRDLNGLKPLRLASQSKDRWDSFELSDSLATEVQFLGAKGTLATLYIGKFSYSQPTTNPMMQQNPYMRAQGKMTTYVRYDDEKEVYAVEGFLGSSSNRNADAFRDKTLLKLNKNELNKIVFSYPADSSFTMVKNEGVWMSDGTPLDSASVATYLSGITSLQGSGFTDVTNSSYTHKAELYTANGNTYKVSAFIEDDKGVFMSSQNPGSIFKEALSRNFYKLFASKEKLLK